MDHNVEGLAEHFCFYGSGLGCIFSVLASVLIIILDLQ